MKITNFVAWKKDLQGWNSNSPVFSELVNEVKPKTIIEIGTWKGASAINMAKACKALGLATTIWCVDTWLGAVEFKHHKDNLGNNWDLKCVHGYPQVYYQFLSNIVHEGVEDMIEPFPNTSENACPYMPMADLIYVDGQHTYKGVTEDLENYFPKLNPGGVMFGDDYTLDAGLLDGTNVKWAEVKKAVDEFAAKKGLRVEVKYNNFWILQ